MRARIAVVALPLVAAGAAAAPARAAGCTNPVMTTANGLGIVQVRKAGATCTTARAVARRATASQRVFVRRSFTVSGARWRCRVTTPATGSDGGTAQTKVRCTHSRQVVRFALAF